MTDPVTDIEPGEGRGGGGAAALDQLRADMLERFAQLAAEIAQLRESVDERVRGLYADIRELGRLTHHDPGRPR